MAQQFTIHIGSRDGGVPVERLLEAVTKTLAVLGRLDARTSGERKPVIHWRVTKATTQSPLALTLTAHVSSSHRDNSHDVVRTYLKGLRKLETGKGMPQDFPDDAIRETRALIGLLDRGLSHLEFSAPGEQTVAPSLRSAAVIDEFFDKRAAFVFDETTLEGSLEVVSVHGAETVDVFDPLSNARVRCVLPEGLLPRAVEALGRRVAVSGRAKFNDQGRPLSIEVQSIRLLRDRATLPKASDFEGSGRLDITGGIESSEFVRRLRDD